MGAFVYKLQPVLEQRLEREEEARQLQAAAQRTLDEARRRHAELEAERDRITARLADERAHFLDVPAGGQIQASVLIERREKIDSLDDQRRNAEAAVMSQQMHVLDCEDEVEKAKQHLNECTREVKVLEKHREKQQLKFTRDQEAREEALQEEIGNSLYAQQRHNQ